MSCKILIVEDDSNIAKYIQACLTIGGYDSEICSDGLSAVERACGVVNVPLARTAPAEPVSSGLEGQSFTYRGEGPYRIPLLGEYQADNAAVVLETVNVLRRRGWAVSEDALNRGLSQARWPGRMELARRSPDVLLDGGHNPQCMEALARSLQALYPGKKLIFLTGVLADKNWTAMMEQLLPLAKEFYTITPDSPRAMSAADLAAWLESRGGRAVPCETVRDGLDQALAAAGPQDAVCACGSLYMIGEARRLLGLC